MKKKIIALAVLSTIIVIGIIIGVINSDWYFNKRVQKSALYDVKLGGNVTYNYYPMYENGTLKARFEFKNIDDESLAYLKNINKDTEPLFTKEYVNKDQFVVASMNLRGSDFSQNGDIHTAQGQTEISKKEFKKIVADRDVYKNGLIKSYKQIVQEFWGSILN